MTPLIDSFELMSLLMGMGLSEYWKKRDFKRTNEPTGKKRQDSHAGPQQRGKIRGGLFVVQKHAARRLHFDLRLQIEDVLASWAVPKGPSLDPEQRRLAIQVEDHPLEYGRFEGEIPPGEYGAGQVIVWDIGEWELHSDKSPDEAKRSGKLVFSLHGKRLKGEWNLIRMEESNWILRKQRDSFARSGKSAEITTRLKKSVLSDKRISVGGK